MSFCDHQPLVFLCLKPCSRKIWKVPVYRSSIILNGKVTCRDQHLVDPYFCIWIVADLPILRGVDITSSTKEMLQNLHCYQRSVTSVGWGSPPNLVSKDVQSVLGFSGSCRQWWRGQGRNWRESRMTLTVGAWSVTCKIIEHLESRISLRPLCDSNGVLADVCSDSSLNFAD